MEKSNKLAWSVVLFFIVCLFIFGVYVLPYIEERLASGSALFGG